MGVDTRRKKQRYTTADEGYMALAYDLAGRYEERHLTIDPAVVEVLPSILIELRPRELYMLALRFGLEDGKAMTFQAIADTFGLTNERIRQVLAKVRRKLRYPSRYNRIKPFILYHDRT